MHAISCISSAVQKWSRQGVNIFTDFFARSAASQDLFKQSQSRLRFLFANVATDKTNVTNWVLLDILGQFVAWSEHFVGAVGAFRELRLHCRQGTPVILRHVQQEQGWNLGWAVSPRVATCGLRNSHWTLWSLFRGLCRGGEAVGPGVPQ